MNSENKRLPYEMPASYFENSALRFLEGAKASEAQEDPILDAEVSKSMPFEVPQAYFEQLADCTLREAMSTEASESTLRSLPISERQEVPEGYFENFATEVIAIISHTEKDIDTDTSFLESIGNAMPFETPQGYFEQLPQVVADAPKAQAAEASQDGKPVMKLNRYKSRGKWATTLAAACVMMIFGFGALWMLKPAENEMSSKQLAFKMLNSVSDEDIEKYIENELENFDIYSLMDNASASNRNSNSRTQILNTESLLEDISSEDIDAYLIYEGI